MTATAGDNRALSDPPIELLKIGPVGGVDSGTATHYVAPVNLVSAMNFTLNTQYGGLTTALGRALGFTLPLDANNNQRVITGITGLEAAGQPTTFIIAATNLATAHGELWSSTLGGSPSQLTLPTVPTTGGTFLTPSLQTYFAILQGWIFLTNGFDTPLKINASLTVTQWGIVAPATGPTLAQTTGGNLTLLATYSYCVTFATALQESSQAQIGAAIPVTTITLTGANDEVNLTNIPVSTDTQVTQRDIYRIGGALGQWRLVKTINDNTTTTASDGLADNAVAGQSLTIYRDPPPPFAYIAVHQNRIMGFGVAAVSVGGTVAANSGALWWSNYNEPWGFNSNTSILYANSTSLDDGAVALASLGSVLVCHKKRSFFFLYGTTDLSFQLYLGGNVGCTSARSVAVAFGVDIWESRQGVYFYNGAGFDPVGNNLSSGKYQQSNIKGFLDGLTLVDRAVSCSFWYDTMYHISFPTKNVTYFYDFRSQQWMTLGWATPVAWYDIEDQIDVVAASNTNTSEVDQWFAGGTDLGNPITSTFTSRRSVADHTEGIKVAAYVVLQSSVQANTMATAQLTLNPGANQVLIPVSPLQFNLAAGNPTHIQDLPNNEWFEMLITASITSSTQTSINEISVWGWITRSLPATLNDGA